MTLRALALLATTAVALDSDDSYRRLADDKKFSEEESDAIRMIISGAAWSNLEDGKEVKDKKIDVKCDARLFPKAWQARDANGLIDLPKGIKDAKFDWSKEKPDGLLLVADQLAAALAVGDHYWKLQGAPSDICKYKKDHADKTLDKDYSPTIVDCKDGATQAIGSAKAWAADNNNKCAQAANGGYTAKNKPTSDMVTAVMKKVWECSCGDSSACFAKDSTLTTPQGEVPLADIQKGDLVATSAGFEEVLGFVHDSAEEKTFQLIKHSNGDLKVTPKHILLLADGSELQADDLKVGDTLASVSGSVTVQSIEQISQAGFASPVTSSGTIVVNGLVASTYSMEAGVPHWMAHGALSPFFTAMSALPETSSVGFVPVMPISA